MDPAQLADHSHRRRRSLRPGAHGRRRRRVRHWSPIRRSRPPPPEPRPAASAGETGQGSPMGPAGSRRDLQLLQQPGRGLRPDPQPGSFRFRRVLHLGPQQPGRHLHLDDDPRSDPADLHRRQDRRPASNRPRPWPAPAHETWRHTCEQVAFDTTTAYVNLAKARENVELLGKARHHHRRARQARRGLCQAGHHPRGRCPRRPGLSLRDGRSAPAGQERRPTRRGGPQLPHGRRPGDTPRSGAAAATAVDLRRAR